MESVPKFALKLGILVALLMPCAMHGASRSGKEIADLDLRRERLAKGPLNPAPPRPALDKLKQRVPSLTVETEPLLETPKHVFARSGFLTGPNGEGGALPPGGGHGRAAKDPQRPIKDFLDEHDGVFGHGAEVLEKEHGRLIRDAVTAHNGLHTTAWEQRLDELTIFEAVLVGHVSARGELVAVSSEFVPQPARAADVGTPNRQIAQLTPPITARQAIVAASGSVGEPVDIGEMARLSPRPTGREQLELFQAGTLPGAVQTRLVWLPQSPYSLRLCWEVELTRHEGGERYRVLVDALDGEVLIRRRLTVYLSDAVFRVFTGDSPTPFSPAWSLPDTNQPPVVERSLVRIGALDTNASPIGWISDGENETRGNNVDAHLDRNADDIADLPRPQGNPFRVFDPPLNLSQEPAANSDAAVVQLFYWCNWMHDRLHGLGFDEASGNFQKDNFGRGGVGNDAVQADAQDGSGFNNANFTPSPDGVAGRIQMFLWNGPTPDVDGDFDAEVVLHEYTHGLSTRLVGAGAGISALQTAGMGEGWSDFYALSFLSQASDDVDGVYAFGGYAVQQLNGLQLNYYFGIRRYPYSTSLSKNPLTFRDIDPFQVNPHPGVPISPLFGFNPLTANEVHSQGEVWCAMLWDVRAAFVRKYGFETGNETILRLVTDGMKLSPFNPTFTQARDAIIQADLVNNQGANYGELWMAFARRGLGFSAQAPDANTTSNIREAYDLPDSLVITRAQRLVSSGAQGGPFAAPCQVYPLTNFSSAALPFGVHFAQGWLSVTPERGVLPPGGSTNITVCVNANANGLPLGTFTDTVTFSNVLSGVTQERDAQLTVMRFVALPFEDGFEAGELSPAWAVSGTGPHQVKVTELNSPHSGRSHLTLDSVDGFKARNELTLGLDLAGYTNVVLRFWVKSFGDEADGPPPTPFIGGADFDGVAISTDGVAWYEVLALRELDANYVEQIVPLDQALIKHKLAYNSTFHIRFNQVDDFQIPFDGLALDDIRVTGLATRRVSVSLPTSAIEGAGVIARAGVVKVGVPLLTPLVVQLTSSQPGKLGLPASVTIPAGTNEAAFDLTFIDDGQLDGTTTVSVRAEANGYTGGSATLRIADNEKANLRVSLPPHAREGDGLLERRGVIRVNARPVRDVQVQLISSDPVHLRVPPSVVLPAGANNATFDLMVGDEDRIDGDHTVSVTAHVDGWTDGTDRMLIRENDAPALALALPPSISENSAGTTNRGTVRLSGRLPTDLVVSLTSGALDRLRLPATVTVPAGALQASFELFPVNNSVIDGRRSVTLTARAPGFDAASAVLTIDDDETPTAPTQPLPSDRATNVALTPNLVWNPGVGNILINGGFETGDLTGWSQINGGYGAWVLNDGKINPDGPEEPTPPLAGKYGVLVTQFGGGNHHLYQDVYLPADALGATLSWADRIHNYATYFAPNQAFRVEVRNTNNIVLAVAFETKLGDPLLNDWTNRTFDLSPFRGSSVRIAFVELDSIGYLNVNLDEISVTLGDSATPTTFDVYFGTTPTLASTDFRGNSTNALWVLPRLGLNSTYYWQVVSRRGAGQTRGPVWQFTTRGVGALHHFEWGRIASPQFLGQRFAATLTAKDEVNNTVKDFTGSVQLSALPGRSIGSSIVVTELDIGNADSVEFANTTRHTLDLSMWQITLYDSTSWPAPLTTFTIPQGTFCPPGAYFRLEDNGEGPGQFPAFNAGTNVTWSLADFGNPIAVLVRDPSGSIVDFVCAGDATPSLIKEPVVLPEEEWSGPPLVAALAVFTASLQRVGQADHNDGSDWVRAPITLGKPNPGLELPFAPPPALAMTPTVASNFVTGIWTGYITLDDVAPSVTLRAEDAQGRFGLANELAIGADNNLAVRVSDSPDVVLLGEELTYRVVVTNSGPTRATGVTLTNLLPAEVTFLNAATFDGACEHSNGIVRCQLNNIFPGDSARLTLTTRALFSGRATNVALIGRAESDGFLADNRTVAISTVTGPSISTTNLPITEGNAPTNMGHVIVRLSAACQLPVSVHYESSNGTAQAGLDYIPVSGTLRFEPGMTNLFIDVPILGDRLDEGLETFNIHLSDPSNGVLIVSQARIRISDDDPTPRVTVNDVSVREGGPGSTNEAFFTATLSAPSGLPASVDFFTEDITATAPSDYLTAFGTFLFPPGATSQTVRVLIRGDRRFEGDETFSLTLANPSSCTLARTAAIGTILDDDEDALDHFTWNSVSSPQALGVPFPATLTAFNGLSQVATGYHGLVTVRGITDSRQITIGRQTNTWEFPLGTLYHDARTQVIYPAGELGGAARISALALEVATAPGQQLSNWTLRLKHIPFAEYQDSGWESEGWTTNYQNHETVAGSGWVTFLFDQPFMYDGTNSLLVDLSFNNATWTANGLVRSTETSTRRSLVFQTDSAFGDPLAWSGRAIPPPTVSTRIPNLRLFAESLVPMTPTGTVELVNGAWNGLVTIHQTGTNIFLRANDRDGHIAIGNLFDVATTADSDGDGLPDAWEKLHFGAADARPQDDPDRDGLTNLEEFANGTNPLDAASGGVRLETVVALDGQVRIRFQSRPGGRYQLERTPSLRQAAWTPVGSLLTANGSLSEISEPSTQTAPKAEAMFYRVRCLP
jgi:uncharacterized repeat protein (TIGR01451 family)